MIRPLIVGHLTFMIMRPFGRNGRAAQFGALGGFSLQLDCTVRVSCRKPNFMYALHVGSELFQECQGMIKILLVISLDQPLEDVPSWSR